MDATAISHDDRCKAMHTLRRAHPRRLGRQSRAEPGAPGDMPGSSMLPLQKSIHLRQGHAAPSRLLVGHGARDEYDTRVVLEEDQP